MYAIDKSQPSPFLHKQDSDNYVQPQKSKSKLEFSPESITESRNSLGNIFLAGCSEGGAEEHTLLLEFAVWLEPATTRDEGALVDGSLENVLFDLVARLSGGYAGVFLPVDFDPVLGYLLVYFSGWEKGV